MSSIAKISNGTLLQIGDGASPEVFTTVPEVMQLTGPNVRFDMLDVTSHDTVGFFREWIPGLADGETITGKINWRPSNTIHKGIRVDQYARTNRNFKIVFPDSSFNTVQCSTYIQQNNPSADIGQVLRSDLNMKITGQPTWT
jgi:predicted secreted protein